MARHSVSLLALLLTAACSSGPAATSAELDEALASATDGDVVEVASGRFVGAFRVPAGVTLRGAGPDTVLEGSEGSVLSVGTSSGSTSTVANVRIESAGSAGIVVYGGGAAQITDVDVAFSLGVGVAAEAIASLTMERVTITGTVTAAVQPMDPTPQDSSSHGLLLVDVTDARLTDVNVRGAAIFGALIIDSGVTWSGGGVDGNLGTGLMFYGGSASLDSIAIANTLQGFRLPPVFGGVFANGVTVSSIGLSISSNEGIGIVHVGTSATHRDLVGIANANAAIWLQETDGVSIEGASRFTDNEFASIVAIDTTNLTIDGAMIENTVLATRIVGLAGRIEVGDGIQLVRPIGAVLSNVTLASNERAGLLLELGSGSTSEVTLTSVSTTGSGAELGVVAQQGTREMGWDDGVMRDAATAGNDAAFVAAGIPLDVVAVVTPSDLPQVASIASGGLSIVGVVTPSD